VEQMVLTVTVMRRTLDPDEQRRATALIEQVEHEGMLAMALQPGYHTLMQVGAAAACRVARTTLTARLG
jgi:hypothetical protein